MCCYRTRLTEIALCAEVGIAEHEEGNAKGEETSDDDHEVTEEELEALKREAEEARLELDRAREQESDCAGAFACNFHACDCVL